MGKRSNGEGTIFKRKDGRWCGAYYDEQYNRHFVYAKTQSEVKKKLKEKQGGRTVKTRSYLFQEWIIEFLQKYKKNELKITTYDTYVFIYRKHIQDTRLGKTKLENVKVTDLQQFYNEKIKEGYSSKYFRAIEVILNSALDRAFMLKMIPENPNIFTTIPKKQKYEAKVLTREEVERIVHADSNRLPRQEGRVGSRLYFVEKFCIICTIRKEGKREWKIRQNLMQFGNH